jgi:lysophospholipase L1-like esterase
MNGLVLDVELKCKMAEIICSSEYPLDFENSADAMNMAVAIQLRAGARLYEDILASPNINRFTMMNRDQMRESINNWNTQYQAAIVSLCENANIDANDCFICKITNTSLTKQTILS